ncbi:hypothetical protein TVAG_434590 [Trichomonas vaginalis G3]|uniref:Uncharacterized protein n=1 Tax=Trichomonas vaginalis (strain ATCC PRA-98 / G3) TaxID=412133 RepID=A2DSP2_TRIV3|nr:armadillo (ARM) repeat-containing protein family [Trichomonas vaginalis G3]EAY16622.1 hypothetical protein TVAG_434590 [Trichomonas vaginalis G3]KAI5532999.1 armadillo (ARM) repeat-containing protein family [Trichomonas vaginalis G3]|eukprot:XP_001328845.1 hypothetical protein [Trichomonas vaginalis G3]
MEDYKEIPQDNTKKLASQITQIEGNDIVIDDEAFNNSLQVWKEITCLLDKPSSDTFDKIIDAIPDEENKIIPSLFIETEFLTKLVDILLTDGSDFESQVIFVLFKLSKCEEVLQHLVEYHELIEHVFKFIFNLENQRKYAIYALTIITRMLHLLTDDVVNTFPVEEFSNVSWRSQDYFLSYFTELLCTHPNSTSLKPIIAFLQESIVINYGAMNCVNRILKSVISYNPEKINDFVDFKKSTFSPTFLGRFIVSIPPVDYE